VLYVLSKRHSILTPKSLREWPNERDYMPLSWSLADRAARVAINMSLLTELFAAPPPPIRLVDERRPGTHSKPFIRLPIENVEPKRTILFQQRMKEILALVPGESESLHQTPRPCVDGSSNPPE
jgi:hypothetical protein